MTTERAIDFELRLASAMRTYTDQPGLKRPSEAVVADVLARARPQRHRWVLPAAAAAVVVLVAVVAGIQLLGNYAASRPSTAFVDGREYGIAIVRSLDIPPTALTRYGEVRSDDRHLFADDAVAYAIVGIDPEQALVVAARPGAGDDAGSYGDWILLVRSAVTRQLCPYFDPNSEFTPSECLVEGSP